MKFWYLLGLPWQALSTRARLWLVVFYTLLGFGLLLGFSFANATSWISKTNFLLMANLSIWVPLLPNTLVLARDAHLLRLPSVEREAWQSLWLFAALTIAMPAILLGISGGHVLAIALTLLLGAGVGMAYACTSIYLALLIVFGAILNDHLFKLLGLPDLSQPGFALWAAPTTALSWLLVWRSWRNNVRHNIAATSPRAPMVMKLRSHAWKSYGSGAHENAETTILRQRSDWQQLRPNLNACGPVNPQRCIRLALGGWFMPQTAIGRLRQSALIIAPSLVFVAFMLVRSLGNHPNGSWAKILQSGGLIALIWFGGFGATMLTFVYMGRLWRAWHSPNAGLALLALLPGLGANERSRHNLSRAIIAPVVGAQSLLLVVVLACAISLKLSVTSDLMIALSQLGAIGFAVAFAFAIVGGRMLPTWAIMSLSIFGCMLINISLFTPTLSDPGAIPLGPTNMLSLLEFAWAVLALALIWIGVRGWCGLQARPHAFLPTGST